MIAYQETAGSRALVGSLGTISTAFLEAIPAQVAVLDASGTIVAVNRRWQRFSCENGGDEGGYVGTSYLTATEGAVRDPDATATLSGLQGVLAGELENFEREYPCHDECTERWFRVLVAPLDHQPDGRASGVIVMHVDVTATRLAEKAAHAASEAKARFLATMSHEIRTPLNSLLGAAQLLELTALSARQRDLVRLMASNGRSLDQLLGGILDFSRLEAGRMRLDREPLCPREVARETLDLVRIRAAEKRLDLALTTSERLPERIIGDPARLRQVLLNLLGNAVKFTEAGGVNLSIAAAELNARPALVFTIADTGIGIPGDEIAAVFEPFVQAGASKAGGSGLGLSICRTLVDLMGGEIRLESAEGIGTTVWVTIPYDEPVPESGGSARAEFPATPSLRVLLVEDDPAGRFVVESLLESLGHEVAAVGDGEGALRAALSDGIDAVFVDIQLPDMDGFTVGRLLGRLLGGQIPIIALTANIAAEDLAAYQEARFHDVLGKPVARARMAECLAGVTPGRPSPAPALVEATVNRIASDIGLPRLGEVVRRVVDTVGGVVSELALPPPLPEQARLAHKLKGCAAMVGLDRLGEAAAQLEASAKAGAEDLAADARMLCRILAPASLAAIERWVAEASADVEAVTEPLHGDQ